MPVRAPEGRWGTPRVPAAGAPEMPLPKRALPVSPHHTGVPGPLCRGAGGRGARQGRGLRRGGFLRPVLSGLYLVLRHFLALSAGRGRGPQAHFQQLLPRVPASAQPGAQRREAGGLRGRGAPPGRGAAIPQGQGRLGGAADTPGANPRPMAVGQGPGASAARPLSPLPSSPPPSSPPSP